MRRVRAAVAAAAILACGGALAACSGSSASDGTGGGATTITLYSGQHEQTAQSLITAFEKKTGIQVVVRSDDEDVLADQIATEGTHSPADVFFTENSPPLESLQAKGLLAALPASHARQHAEQVQLAAGRLGGRVGQGQRARLQPEPDLSQPAADQGQ